MIYRVRQEIGRIRTTTAERWTNIEISDIGSRRQFLAGGAAAADAAFVGCTGSSGPLGGSASGGDGAVRPGIIEDRTDNFALVGDPDPPLLDEPSEAPSRRSSER